MSEKTKKQQLEDQLAKLKEAQEKLVALKNSDPSKFTKEQSNQLEQVSDAIFDLEEKIENFGKYVPEKGTEDLVHLMIVRGPRFNAVTGEEVNPANLQMFSQQEFDLFKDSYSRLGYTVTEVLHDPTGEAQALINVTK